MLSGAIPLIGHALEFRRDHDTLFKRGNAKHGKIFGIRLLNKPVAIVTGQEYNRLFYTQTDKALNISEVYQFLEAAFGQVLFIAPKSEYQRQRPALQHIFSREKMQNYILSMHGEVQAWLNSLDDAGEMNITMELQKLTQFVAGHAFLGPQFHDELGPRFWDAYETISKALDPILPPNWPFPKFLRRNRASQFIHAKLKEVIAARRAEPYRYNDLISFLCQTEISDGQKLSDEEISRLFMGLIFAGHETTGGQSAWLITLLLQHPAYQAKVRAEIDAHIPYGVPFNGRMLRALSHTYWAIDETTRLKPAAPLQIRLVEEAVEVGEYTVPAGWLMMVNAANSHFLPEVWSNPETFDPYRFSPERGEGKNSFNIVGFGGGMHKCTGMNFAKNEMAIITALLLQQFDLELLSQNPKTVLGLGASRPSDVWVRYHRRPMTNVMKNTNLHATLAAAPQLQKGKEIAKVYQEIEPR